MTEKKDTPDFDPRYGWTSASNAEADLLCPGRHLAQRGLQGYETKDSAAGTMAHAAFAGTLDIATLSPQQRKTIVRGREIEEHVVETWFSSIGKQLNPENIPQQIAKRAHRELRLWAYRNGQKIHSGGLDAIWFAGDMKFALIEDLKSLFGDVDDAASNLQLRDYAALVYLNYGCEQISVFINQPNVHWNLQDQQLINYREQSLILSVKQMESRVKESNWIGSPRQPHAKACYFCLAAGTDRCPESLKLIQMFSGETECWENFTPSGRSDFIYRTKLVEGLVEKALKFAKDKVKEDPDWATGWHVTKDSSVRTITKGSFSQIRSTLVEAFNSFERPTGEIIELVERCANLSIGQLEEIHAGLTAMDTSEDTRAEFNVLFDHLIEKSTRSGSLKHIN